jgi:hypothetical protein
MKKIKVLQLGIAAILLLCAVSCKSQVEKTKVKKPKQYEVCIASEVHKGEVNHGKSYCVGWAIIREDTSGRKDTIARSYSGKMQWGDEIGKYDKLTERGKYIVDSLKEDGVTQLHDAYLTYEPIYMKPGKKTECLWIIRGEDVIIYEYSFWNNSKGHGFELIKEFAVK